MLGHVFHHVLDGNVDRVFNNSFVQIANDILDHSELLKQLPACLKDFMGKDILFTVNPEIREAFLG
jgi:hypothetical protein